MSQLNAPATWLLAVKARIDEPTLIALTNPGKEVDGGSVDDDRLISCIDDALGEFAVRAGFDPLLTDRSHVACIAQGVVAYLKSYKLEQDETTDIAMIRFMGKCDKLRNTYHAPASTNSNLTPSEEVPTGRTVRPDADRANFRYYLPGIREVDRYDY